MGNPVSHSRSPALHNAAFGAAKLDAVYVPLLVDELPPFLAAFPDLAGVSVTIPHKAGALSPHIIPCAPCTSLNRGHQNAAYCLEHASAHYRSPEKLPLLF